MPIPPAVLGGLISAGSNIIDVFAQGMTNKENRSFSRAMYNQQRKDALADYNMQNLYNSPGEQMKRLKDAGLNPNLVYGTGAATQQAQPVRSSQTPSGTAQAPRLNLGNSIASYIQMKQMDSEIDLRKTQQMVNLIEMVLKGKQGENIDADTATKKFDLRYKQDVSEVQKSGLLADLNKKLADTEFTLGANARANALQAPTIANMVMETALKKINIARSSEEIKEIRARVQNILADTRIKTADANMKEQGIQPHDSPFWRAIQSTFSTEPITMKDYNNLPEFLKKHVDKSRIKK